MKFTDKINKETKIENKSVKEIETELSKINKKTCDYDTFKNYTKSKNEINKLLEKHYEKDMFRKLKFNLFINTHRQTLNFVYIKIFFTSIYIIILLYLVFKIKNDNQINIIVVFVSLIYLILFTVLTVVITLNVKDFKLYKDVLYSKLSYILLCFVLQIIFFKLLLKYYNNINNNENKYNNKNKKLKCDNLTELPNELEENDSKDIKSEAEISNEDKKLGDIHKIIMYQKK